MSSSGASMVLTCLERMVPCSASPVWMLPTGGPIHALLVMQLEWTRPQHYCMVSVAILSRGLLVQE